VGVYLPVIETAENDVKERLSVGVVTWVAARAGCQLTSVDIDRDSVDITIRPVKGEPVPFDFEDREIVIAAFKEKATKALSVTGSLRTERNGRLALENPSNFAVTRSGGLV
jgi:hypothetical protein